MTDKTRPTTNQYKARVQKTLSGYTRPMMNYLAVAWIVNGLLGLLIPFLSMIVILFGLVDFIRLLWPELFPYEIDRRSLLRFRLAALIYLSLGIAGFIMNWSAMQPFFQSFIDWTQS